MKLFLFAFALTSLFVVPKESQELKNLYLKDLQFAHTAILENHPGPYNKDDPGFSDRLEKNYALASWRLENCYDESGCIAILNDFAKAFQDAHLRIQYRQEQRDSPPVHAFGIEEIAPKIHWITVPTFAPDKEDVSNLEEIIEKLSLLRGEDVIIFDLRGNDGGSSFWGDRLAFSLFGREYVDEMKIKLYSDVTVDWRASAGNIAYLESLVPAFIEEYGKTSEALCWLQGIVDSLKRSSNALFRDEAPPQDMPLHGKKMTKSKIIAIVDEQCFSACLNFLDTISAMNHDLTLVGKPTKADSIYMEARLIDLPSKKGFLTLPMKAYHNRPRGNNIPYFPDIRFDGHLSDTQALKRFILMMGDE